MGVEELLQKLCAKPVCFFFALVGSFFFNHSILYKGLKLLQILVSQGSGGIRTNPLWILKDSCTFRIY